MYVNETCAVGAFILSSESSSVAKRSSGAKLKVSPSAFGTEVAFGADVSPISIHAVESGWANVAFGSTSVIHVGAV
jgi:hypothetical protein